MDSRLGAELEYAGLVWSPHKKKHALKLKRLQRMARKIVPELIGMMYEERQGALNLSTLEQRREGQPNTTLQINEWNGCNK